MHSVAAVLALLALAAAPARTAERPRLVVVVSVDQLARHRLSAALPGGLGRLLREGRVFADAALEHGITETCPGHATMLTGVNPGPAGIPGNLLFDGGKTVYCAGERVDPGADVGAAFARTGVLGIPEPRSAAELGEALRSPSFLSVKALGDLLRPGGKVFTLSGKDRAAIMMGGQHPTLAVWLDARAGFTSSRYYTKKLPAWLEAFDRDRGLAPYVAERIPAEWRHGAEDRAALPDESRFESSAFGRTSPHRIRGATLAETHPRLMRTPFADALTLDLARVIVERESLGKGPGTDLLAVSLSATDYIGHAYGPDSQEAVHALRELDRQLEAFLGFLQARVGRGALLVVLTADHGVAPIPEVAIDLGLSECRVPGGRASGERWKELVGDAAAKACGSADAPAVAWDGNHSFKLDPAWLSRCRSKGEALAAIASRLAAQPGVVHVWTAAEMEGDAGECVGYCRFFRNSWGGERSGDLVVQLDPTCQLTPSDPEHKSPYVTGHGTPYAYDRAVPLVFWGGGVAPGVVRGQARTIDIAPTLARRLGLPAQPEWNGRALPLE
ncbi:MAG TPA: alkaline phosphatase family protein [Anaeromyxobacter sp.]